MLFCFCQGSFAQRAPKPSSPPPSPPPPQPTSNSNVRSPFPGGSIFGRDAPVSESDRAVAVRNGLKKFTEPLYREPTKKELESVAPDPDLYNTYAEFLRQPNTGLFKLVPDSGCVDDPKVVSALANCLAYPFPGGGNSYSFRTKNYRLRSLADLTYTQNLFQVTGVLTQGIFVNLGDGPLEGVSMQTPGMGYLANFRHAKQLDDANAIDKQLAAGVKQDGRVYSLSTPVSVNNTYAIRSVAYRGMVPRAVRGISYNELDFDKRRDVIVAFRVVRMDPVGSISILWKQLTDAESPKLKQERSK